MSVDIDDPSVADLGYVLMQCQTLQLKPMLIYETFRSTPDEPRLRVVFHVDELITDGKQFSSIQRRLIQALDGDGTCKNPDRLFYGSRKGSIVHYDSNTLVSIAKLLELDDPGIELDNGVKEVLLCSAESLEEALSQLKTWQLLELEKILLHLNNRIDKAPQEKHRYEFIWGECVHIAMELAQFLPADAIATLLNEQIEANERWSDWEHNLSKEIDRMITRYIVKGAN